jgi:hypothetical protein
MSTWWYEDAPWVWRSFDKGPIYPITAPHLATFPAFPPVFPDMSPAPDPLLHEEPPPMLSTKFQLKTPRTTCSSKPQCPMSLPGCLQWKQYVTFCGVISYVLLRQKARTLSRELLLIREEMRLRIVTGEASKPTTTILGNRKSHIIRCLDQGKGKSMDVPRRSIITH